MSVYQVVEGIKPTLLELQKFETAPEDVELEGKNCTFVSVIVTRTKSNLSFDRTHLKINPLSLEQLVVFTVTPSKTKIKTIECLKPRI